MLEASAGNALRFRVAVVLDEDEGGKVPDDVRAALDELLAAVSADLKIE